MGSKRALQICQNKALRAVLKVGNRYPTEELHTETGIEWLGVSRAKSSCVEVYKLLSNNGSNTMCNLVQRADKTRKLRSNSRVQILRHRTKTKWGEHDIIIRGIQYWDMLDDFTQGSPSLAVFKRRIKQSSVFNIPQYTNYKNVAYL